MAVVVEQSAQATGFGTSFTGSLSGVDSESITLMFYALREDNDDVIDTAGWTEIMDLAPFAGSSAAVHVYWKKGGDTAAVTPASTAWCWYMVEISGLDTTSPVFDSGIGSQSSSTTFTTATIQNDSNDEVYPLAVGGWYGDGSGWSGANMTLSDSFSFEAESHNTFNFGVELQVGDIGTVTTDPLVTTLTIDRTMEGIAGLILLLPESTSFEVTGTINGGGSITAVADLTQEVAVELNGGGSIAATAQKVSASSSATMNGGGAFSATTEDHLNQVLRPASTITAGAWDTAPSTGQNLHDYAGDDSDATYVEDTLV